MWNCPVNTRERLRLKNVARTGNSFLPWTAPIHRGRSSVCHKGPRKKPERRGSGGGVGGNSIWRARVSASLIVRRPLVSETGLSVVLQ